MPLQFMVTAEAYSRMYRGARRTRTRGRSSRARHRPDRRQMNTVRPARDVIFDMVEEYGEAVERMRELSY